MQPKEDLLFYFMFFLLYNRNKTHVYHNICLKYYFLGCKIIYNKVIRQYTILQKSKFYDYF